MNSSTIHIDSVLPINYESIPAALFAARPGDVFATIWTSENESESVTFGEFRRRALAQAALFRNRGISDGQTVILVMPQGIALMAAFAGVMISGGVPAVLAYPNFKTEPAKYTSGLKGVSRNLNASLILVGKDFPGPLIRHLSGNNTTEVVSFSDDCPTTFSNNTFCEPRANDVAFIQHSAGTTGLQKGVALSHGVVLKHIDQLRSVLNLTCEDRIYSWLPLYHDMGLIACFMLPLICHLPVVMQSPSSWVMQPASMLALISKYRCSLAWIPNFAFQFLARRIRAEDRASADLSSLRALINCSEPIRDSSVKEFLTAFSESRLANGVVQTSYAMAETVFAVTHSKVSSVGPTSIWIDSEIFRKENRAVLVPEGTSGSLCMVSSGRCLANTEVCIRDGEGKALGPGLVGEVTIRSETMFQGYHNRPDLTAQALRDGCYYSGDLGFTLNGEVYVVGRKNDLIIVAGENVFPQDIEEIVASHTAIHDGRVVAFGHYNPALGTQDVLIIAEVTEPAWLNNSRAVEREIRSAVSSELNIGVRSIFLKPSGWVIKSTAGKPARSSNRDKLFYEHPELRREIAHV